jgi:hypothetical protein
VVMALKLRKHWYGTVSVLGITIGLSGLILKPHRLWLVHCGLLTLNLNGFALYYSMRKMALSHLARLGKLKRLCDITGVRFGIVNATVYRWFYPSISASLFLSVVFLVAATTLNTSHMPLHYASDGFGLLAGLGAVTLVTRLRSVESILCNVESLINSGKVDTSAPATAKFILLLVPKRNREHLIGDLEEEYRTILLPEYGVSKARNWYRWQVALSIGPLLWAQVKRGAALAWLWKRVR